MALPKEEFRIFAGNAHPLLAEEIAKELKVPLSKLTLKQFACGETFINLEETVRGRHVFIINTCNQGEVDQNFMETFLLCDAAKRSFAKEVHVIMPYFGYSRQDKIHNAREPISAKLMANLLVRSGMDHLITLHLHSEQIQAFFDVPVDNLSARRLFVEKLKKENIKNPVVVSTDAGGAKYAKRFADELGTDLAILHKSRPSHNEATTSHVIGDVAGKTAIIVDDMIDTAGSVMGAKNALLSAGANKDMYMVITHPILSGPAVERLKEANFHKILFTNSIPLPKGAENLNIEIISVAPLVSRGIENLLKRKSVSQLFF